MAVNEMKKPLHLACPGLFKYTTIHLKMARLILLNIYENCAVYFMYDLLKALNSILLLIGE